MATRASKRIFVAIVTMTIVVGAVALYVWLYDQPVRVLGRTTGLSLSLTTTDVIHMDRESTMLDAYINVVIKPSGEDYEKAKLFCAQRKVEKRDTLFGGSQVTYFNEEISQRLEKNWQCARVGKLYSTDTVLNSSNALSDEWILILIENEIVFLAPI